MRAIGAAGIPSQSTVLIPAPHQRIATAYRKHVLRPAGISARCLMMLCIFIVLAGLAGCKRKVPLAAAEGAAPKIGERAPAFTLPTATGQSVSLGQFLGESKVVLVFYRGYW